MPRPLQHSKPKPVPTDALLPEDYAYIGRMMTDAFRHALSRRYPAMKDKEADRFVLLARIKQLEDAIREHRNCIHGPDYDYENDETYRPEAELYRVLGD